MPTSFTEAIKVLPPAFRTAAMSLPEQVRNNTEELRLRTGRYMSYSISGTEHTVKGSAAITAGDLARTVDMAAQGSIHSALEPLKHGYITLPGGHRMGLCGTGVIKDGSLGFVRDVSSVCIRVARQKKGIADNILPKLFNNRQLCNTLIISPPGAGKTTLLRDIARVLSDGTVNTRPMRVAIADERGEIAACHGGIPQLDVGSHTDVWTGLVKHEAAMLLLRGLSPEVLVMDEITEYEDAKAVKALIGCGVSVISTAHAAGLNDLHKRQIYINLADSFDRYVLIELVNGIRQYSVLEDYANA